MTDYFKIDNTEVNERSNISLLVIISIQTKSLLLCICLRNQLFPETVNTIFVVRIELFAQNKNYDYDRSISRMNMLLTNQIPSTENTFMVWEPGVTEQERTVHA